MTKLIFDGYYTENSAIYPMKYGSNNVFDTSTGIGSKLNNDVLNSLTIGSNQEKLKAMILTEKWYQNTYSASESYTVSLATNETPINAKVGLIRVGEMLSGQSYSILTENGTIAGTRGDVQSFWQMTPASDNLFVFHISVHGPGGSINALGTALLRPVINVSSSNTISSGNGTLNSPYVIEVK